MSEPKISVIIPLYNAERFIRQCLISVLASKFTDYEVLVVDDCSTDNSVAEVKKLLPHFDGRLKIFSTEKNSGGAGIPRNVGIKNSAGKYIIFVDADDFILPTALGNFLEVAENFQADLIHTEKFLWFNDAGKSNFTREELRLYQSEAGKNVEMPTLETADLRERIRRHFEKKSFWVPWGKFFRRDFIVENKIDFPDVALAEDLVFGFKCICAAKRTVRVPYVTNIYRKNSLSASNKKLSSEDSVRLWLKILLKNAEILDDFMNGCDFFQANPDVRRDVLKFCADVHFNMIEEVFQNAKPYEVQKIFFEELQNPALNPNGKNLVAAYLYAERILNQTR